MNGEGYRFHDTSVWVEDPPDRCPPLRGDERADVVIIGGGLTGLNTALSLREEGVDVAILEKDYCGKGSSGRNAGHLTPTIGKDLPTLVRYFGKDKAVELAQYSDRAVRHTEETIRKLEIDCDYAPVGNIVAGMHPRHRAPLERSAELAGSLGVGVQFLSEAEMRARQLPEIFRFGMLENCGGHLHPGKYVLGLRRAARRAGVRIYEGTEVCGFDESTSPVKVRTAGGSIHAQHVVVATNAYTTTTLGKLKFRLAPLRVTLFQTPELDAEQLNAIGWRGREGVYTAHEALESYRLTADNRLTGGSKYVQYGYGGTMRNGFMPDLFDEFTRLLKFRFQHVPRIGIESFWGGWIAMTLDFLPLVYSNRQRTVFYGVGYNGHGIAHATLNGSVLADMIQGRPNENLDCLQRRIIPLPPEPLRWLGVNALKWYFDRIDRAVDKDLRLGRV